MECYSSELPGAGRGAGRERGEVARPRGPGRRGLRARQSWGLTLLRVEAPRGAIRGAGSGATVAVGGVGRETGGRGDQCRGLCDAR